jgi:DNA-directed RNA polymerase II subunit RPB2
MTYKQEDMPMTEDGIVPDIIVNPNGIPKRMSIGQLIECAFSKVGALKGLQLDGTPYRKTEVMDIIPVLENLGFKGSGSEVLYNGKTGEQLASDIFIGPTFYYRLKHLVQDKIHSRASGPYQLLTKQPAEGRSRDGGLRVGEMERDALISHGVVGFLKERMFDCSDKYYVWVDKETGMISPVNPAKKKYVSLYSNNTTKFAKVQIPHASKLLFQELMSLGIVPRIFTSSKV